MASIKTSLAVLATALLAFSGVQSQAVYYIDPNTVPLSIRTSWCSSQLTACPLLCLQLPGASSTTTSNTCNPNDLTYTCICGNGLTPNASEFSQTLPYFLCTEYGNQCVAGCNGVTTCQSDCRTQHPCGAQNPTRINATTSSSTTASATLPAGATSGTAGIVFTGIGGGLVAATTAASASTTKSGADAALDLGRSYGLVILFTGLFAGFALLM